MMNILNFLKSLFNKQPNSTKYQENGKKEEIYEESLDEFKEEIQVISIWDILKTQENTQANHLVSVISFDEWISMEEIIRRIWDIFQIEYKNDRSLYPYLKTMVDLGLIETSNIGGRRKWRKKDLLIKKSEKKKEKQQIEEKIASN